MARRASTTLGPVTATRGRHRSGSSRRAALARLEWIADLMDSAVIIPGTNVRLGLDALIGLAPGVGDTVSAAISLWLVKEAHELGVPRHLIGRMIGNIVLDGVVGAVPVAGDLFDVMFRANRRNMKLLREHFEREGWE